VAAAVRFGSVTVAAIAPPTIAKAFGGQHRERRHDFLTFTLANPNTATRPASASPTPCRRGSSSPPNGLAGTCGGGTITAVAGSGTTLAAASLVLRLV
jgi:hypothetical protein